MTEPGLTPRLRRKIARNNLRALFGIGGRRRLQVQARDGAFELRQGDDTLWLPSAQRILRYRQGMAARIRRVAEDYGAGRDYPFGPNETVIDIGANIGEFSLAVAAQSRRVIAIEPDPDCFACLCRNVAAHANIETLQTLLWSEPTELTFHSEPGHGDSSVFAPDSGDATQSLTLPARTLDDIAAELQIGSVDLLKCDAEGAEPEVLEGASAVLARTRLAAIDTGPERDGERTNAACSALLRAAGMTVTEIVTHDRHVTIGRRMDPA
jgi:FkbM family methyltransferase